MSEIEPFRPPLPRLRCTEALDAASATAAVWETSLVGPVGEFLARPSKRFRGTLVRLGFLLGAASEEVAERSSRTLVRAEALLEQLHAGSLIVDDVEDGSELRRGAPTLHRLVGTPAAINCGNWLYYLPLDEVAQWGLDAERERLVYRACHDALLRAHYGQALDLGATLETLPQGKVAAVCLASLELKTGALTALALSLGAILSGALPAERAALDRFGHRFGLALQMFDDLGNLREKRVDGLPDGKQYEDLRLRRPSWVWAAAARFLGAEDYAAFVAASALLPASEELDRLFVRTSLLVEARAEARRELARAEEEIAQAIPTRTAALTELRALGVRLVGAYE